MNYISITRDYIAKTALTNSNRFVSFRGVFGPVYGGLRHLFNILIQRPERGNYI